MRRFICTTLLLAGAAFTVCGQWASYPLSNVPRTAAGKLNLSAPAPRTPDGKPDLSGTWMVQATPYDQLKRLLGNADALAVPGDDPHMLAKYFLDVLWDEKEPEVARPQTLALLGKRLQSGLLDSPANRCLPLGISQSELTPLPYKIVQTPSLVVMVFEAGITFRQIFMDGRKPAADPNPSYMGYSVGKWDGDTLVIDSTGFNDRTWLDAMGHGHSEDLHLTERIRRPDAGHLNISITFDDPKMYLKPWTIQFSNDLLTDSDVFEYVCNENEKDVVHMTKR